MGFYAANNTFMQQKYFDGSKDLADKQGQP